VVKSEASEENYWEQINWPHVRRRVTNEKLPLVDHTAFATWEKRSSKYLSIGTVLLLETRGSLCWLQGR